MESVPKARMCGIGFVALATAIGSLSGCAGGTATSASQATASPTAATTTTTDTTTTDTTTTEATSSDAAASTTPTSIPSGVANGTQLATYSFDLPALYSTALGVGKPSRTDFNPPSGSDISNDGYGRLASNEQVLDLGGAAPTYQGCVDDNRIESHASATAGTTFCVVETGHRIAGVTVKSVGKTESGSSYVTLDVTVWQNSQT